MMKTGIGFAVALMALTGGVAEAATMRVEIQGTTLVNEGSDFFFGQGVKDGDPFLITFDYDTSVGNTLTNPSNTPNAPVVILNSGSSFSTPSSVRATVSLAGLDFSVKGEEQGYAISQATNDIDDNPIESALEYKTIDQSLIGSVETYWKARFRVSDFFGALPLSIEDEHMFVPSDDFFFRSSAGLTAFQRNIVTGKEIYFGDLDLLPSRFAVTRLDDNPPPPAPVPLPASAPLLLVAIGGIAALRRRRTTAAC